MVWLFYKPQASHPGIALQSQIGSSPSGNLDRSPIIADLLRKQLKIVNLGRDLLCHLYNESFEMFFNCQVAQEKTVVEILATLERSRNHSPQSLANTESVS